ncbi:hypothetical protein [Pseudomonas hamedanensis]|uniref:Sporulation protein n=1 Tax=Pseudomonas hamedanensis TaxID=2745504 RepID=A0A9E6TH58_9PSED|nr:hypothetical protein [Pseudomonas hamedanensis]QXI17333.1 hypothetical protein HU739_026195 [Pseudomonas hamedanensis]
MRWLFLLLIVLNVFYYVWHQQEAPLRAKDVTPLSLYRGSQQDIRLLSEAAGNGRIEEGVARQQCLFLGGFSDEDSIIRLQQRLSAMKVNAQSAPKDAAGSGFWLTVTPEGQRLLGDQQLQNLSKEFNELKHKIMLCEGVAPAE